VFSLSTLVFTGFFFLLCGTALGAFLLHIFRSNIYSRELEDRLNEAESSLQNYQRDVASSFSQTAQHIGDMTRCYREMHEHLASSALRLATPEISRKILDSANSLGEAQASHVNVQHLEPPRDWAPKPVGAKGVLSEDYGLRDEDTAEIRPTETPEDFDFDDAVTKRY
jgi:uncharacterized membrane-anchored protein YhcB (DUF1043 family)